MVQFSGGRAGHMKLASDLKQDEKFDLSVVRTFGAKWVTD
jgi:hypothetical protein